MKLVAVDYQAENAAQQFVESLRETGFGVLKNHPIKQELVSSIYANWQKFFDSEPKHDFLFDKEKQWGGFPAVSIGWVVSKENFLSEVEAINRLAFRASYGATGNNSIDPFLYQQTLNSANYIFYLHKE